MSKVLVLRGKTDLGKDREGEKLPELRNEINQERSNRSGTDQEGEVIIEHHSPAEVLHD